MDESILSSLENNQDQRQVPGENILVPQPEAHRLLARKVEKDVAKAMPKIMGFKQEASTAEQAYDGHQWDEMDKMRLEQLRRPTIVFNEIKPTINAISGIERLNRADIRFVSRPLDSQPMQDEMGDLASEAYAAALDLCSGDAERSRAIKDMSIGGMGWYEIKMDYETEPDGKLVLERFPWREGVWDTSARKENLDDSRWRGRKREVPREEFKARWPKKLSLVDVGTPEYSEMNVTKYELVTPYYSLDNEKQNPQVGEQSVPKNSIPVIQYQWKESVPVHRFYDPSAPDQITELREKEFNSLKSKLEMLGMPAPEAVRQQKTIYKQVFVARGVVLEDPVELVGGFSLKCVTGEWDDHKKVWYGIVRPLLDPQKTMNKSMSTALTMFLTNAKGGVMFETGAFADPEMAKNQWSRADAWLEMNEGGAQKIVQRQPINHQGAVDLFFNESKAAMNYVSGIPGDMMGMAVGEANAPTIMKRVQAALSVLGWYFDNITRARRDEARTMLEYVRSYWSQGQLIRIGGPTNGKAIPLLRSNLPITYDLMLDESVRHNPNLKAQVWQDLQPIIPALLKFGLGKFLLTILKFSPLPAQLVNELQQEAQQTMQQGGQMGNRGPTKGGQQTSPQEQQAKAAKLNAEAQKAIAEARRLDQESALHITELTLDAVHKAETIRQKDELQRHRQISDTMKLMHGFMGKGTAKNYVG